MAKTVFNHTIMAGQPEVFVDREVALQERARRYQYSGKSPGELAQIAEQLCLSAARLKRFDTLSSHLCELEKQATRNSLVFQ